MVTSVALTRVEETFFKVYDRFGGLSPGRRRSDGHRGGATILTATATGSVLGEERLLLLESASAADARGAHGYGEVLGAGASCRPRGRTTGHRVPTVSVRDAGGSADAKLRSDEIAAVIGTANGSPVLDRMESNAIATIFGNQMPVASIKGAIGESGASGRGGIIAGLFSHARCTVVPTSGPLQSDPALMILASRHLQSASGTTFLVNSVASGGPTTA